MKKNLFTLFYLITLPLIAQKAVTELRADGPGNTYDLINSKFAIKNTSVIEAPGLKIGDCDNHSWYINSEGTSDHITEIYDPEKGNIFEFVIHLKEDKDRNKCNKKDRQRNEIKIHNSSPENLKGNIGETFIYQWSMKLPKDFQVSNSFTHFHQLKSKGGIVEEEKIPLITITGYKKSKGDEMHVRYSGTTEQNTVAKASFDEFRGQWVNFSERIKYKKGKGEYELLITNQKTGKIILNYKSKKMITYKKDALFMRPKWGIYRSILHPDQLKDEKVFYEFFKITEIN